MLGHIAGLKPNKLNDTTIRFTRGSVASFSPPYDIAVFPGDYDVNLGILGLGGLDNGGMLPWKDYFFYVVKNVVTGEVGIVASRNNAPLSFPSLSSDWIIIRKLALGLCLNSTGRLRDFHASCGPSWDIQYTGMEGGASTEWCALVDGDAQTWTSVPCDKWVPDNSRMALIEFEVQAPSQAGSAFIRTIANGGRRVNSASPLNANQPIRDIWVSLRSKERDFFYYVTGGAKLYARVSRYQMTEPVT